VPGGEAADNYCEQEVKDIGKALESAGINAPQVKNGDGKGF
jgi:hypothetical protein